MIYLDNILVYTEDPEQSYVKVKYWVLEQLQKYGFYANLKKCQFYKNKVQFLDFVILA